MTFRLFLDDVCGLFSIAIVLPLPWVTKALVQYKTERGFPDKYCFSCVYFLLDKCPFFERRKIEC